MYLWAIECCICRYFVPLFKQWWHLVFSWWSSKSFSLVVIAAGHQCNSPMPCPPTLYAPPPPPPPFFHHLATVIFFTFAALACFSFPTTSFFPLNFLCQFLLQVTALRLSLVFPAAVAHTAKADITTFAQTWSFVQHHLLRVTCASTMYMLRTSASSKQNTDPRLIDWSKEGSEGGSEQKREREGGGGGLEEGRQKQSKWCRFIMKYSPLRERLLFKMANMIDAGKQEEKLLHWLAFEELWYSVGVVGYQVSVHTLKNCRGIKFSLPIGIRKKMKICFEDYIFA